MKLDSISVRLEHCAKTFKGASRPTLEPVCLDISAGETIVLLGPSGCGKTTTLRLIAGLESPDTGGRVWFGNEDVTERSIEKRQVGMVFQNYALFPNMNVRENVSYGLRIQKQAPQVIADRVNELLALTRLETLADRPISQLSGGQRQRVALARALAPQPRILLLDEPLTALDAQLRESLRAEMNTLLRKLGVTTVYVTHDQGEAMVLADRIVVMSSGRIEQIGTPREIYYHPANATVARFIGTINQIEGHWNDGAFHCQGGTLQAVAHADPIETLWFRPEDAMIMEPGENRLNGEIAAVTFLGERTRLHVKGISPQPVWIDAPGRSGFAPGDPIGISLPDDIWHTRLPQQEAPSC